MDGKGSKRPTAAGTGGAEALLLDLESMSHLIRPKASCQDA